MLISSKFLERGIRAEFNKAMDEFAGSALKIYEGAYTAVTSTGKDEKYAWLGSLPKMREWIGQRLIKTLADYDYTITNKPYEATLGVDRDEVEDDQIGGILPRVRALAQGAIQFPHELISALILAGTSSLAFDGIAFFSNASGVRVNDNLLAGTGVTLAQVEVDLATARATMRKFVDDQGKAMGVVGDCIVCPPEMEVTFKKIIQSTTAAGQSNPGVSNPFQGVISKVIVDPWLTDANDWYLLATSYPIRPIILQSRKAPVFTALDRDTDKNVFEQRQLVYGVDMRCAVGYGLPQLGAKIVNT